ncbi:MAG TPA: response regulator [Rhodopseudomonas sp.]|uniref:response regulator n=1 Tax=Rhodopseudomonas sp. TaxID=1078 RepID=UPI002ED97DF4
MTVIHLLHIDDEPDIREIVEISLAVDPDFVVRSCSSGQEALPVAAEWQPDIILLDVMMPVMDGPATLARLRDNPATQSIPVIFMTARAQTRELDRFRSLGAVGIIPKPFDPMTLATSVRNYVQSVDPLERACASFVLRAAADAATLGGLRAELDRDGDPTTALAAIRRLAHGLAGAGGIFGFPEISEAGAALEDAIIASGTPPTRCAATDAALERLIRCAKTGHVSTPTK